MNYFRLNTFYVTIFFATSFSAAAQNLRSYVSKADSRLCDDEDLRLKKRLERGIGMPDLQYKDTKEVEDFLFQKANSYPHIMKLVDLDRPNSTTFGRNKLRAALLTLNPHQHDPTRPSVYFNSAHHPRELMTIEVTLDLISTILENYDKDNELKWLVDHTNIWVVPVANPDGLDRVWTPGGRFNRRNVGDPKLHPVDLNRNYPHVGNGCPGYKDNLNKNDDTYRGPAPESEREVQNLVKFIRDIRPIAAISYHSATESLIYPEPCHGQSPPNQKVYRGVAREIATSIPRDCQYFEFYRYGEGWSEMYQTQGADTDWMHAELGTIAFTLEINNYDILFFQPNYEKWRDKTVNKIRVSWRSLLEQTWAKAIHGQIEICEAGRLAKDQLSILVEEKSQLTEKKPVTQKSKGFYNGFYHLILEPGSTYDIIFSSENCGSLRKSNEKLGNARRRIDGSLPEGTAYATK